MTLADSTLQQLIDELGARTPAPGGGAAASITAAVGAALGAMVINWSLGRASLERHEEENRSHLDALQHGAARALELAEEDAQGYEALNALMKLPEDDAVRREQWSDAVDGAMVPPIETLELCLSMAGSLSGLVGATNTMLKSDLAAAAVLVEAAGRTAAWNIHANLSLVEEAQATELATRVSGHLGELRTVTAQVEQSCR